MKNPNEQLTSLHVNSEDFKEFKTKILGTTTNLKKLVEYSMKLYLFNEKFREMVDKYPPGGEVSAQK